MSDTATITFDTLTALRRNGGANSNLTAIAEIWQFWLDATMTISLIAPPNGTDPRAFPCGEDAIGRPLFEVLDLDANVTNAVALYNQFRAQERFHNVKFICPCPDGTRRTVLISGSPISSEANRHQGFRCTVIDISAAIR